MRRSIRGRFPRRSGCGGASKRPGTRPRRPAAAGRGRVPAFRARGGAPGLRLDLESVERSHRRRVPNPTSTALPVGKGLSAPPAAPTGTVDFTPAPAVGITRAGAADETADPGVVGGTVDFAPARGRPPTGRPSTSPTRRRRRPGSRSRSAGDVRQRRWPATRSSACSAAARWVSCTRPGSAASTASSP